MRRPVPDGRDRVAGWSSVAVDDGQTADAIERGENAGETGGLVMARIEQDQLGDGLALGAILTVTELASLLGAALLSAIHGDLLLLSPDGLGLCREGRCGEGEFPTDLREGQPGRTHNIKRMLSMIGVRELMKAISA